MCHLIVIWLFWLFSTGESAGKSEQSSDLNFTIKGLIYAVFCFYLSSLLLQNNVRVRVCQKMAAAVISAGAPTQEYTYPYSPSMIIITSGIEVAPVTINSFFFKLHTNTKLLNSRIGRRVVIICRLWEPNC